MQKVVIAKALASNPDILIFDEPTRGIDIKAKNEIYNLLLEEKEKGKSILVFSPEVRELLNICSRLLVVHNGTIVAEVKQSDNRFTEKGILEIMHAY